MAHSLTSSATTLADGNVVTVLVLDLPRVYAHPKGCAFAAVMEYGSVVTWRDAGLGGNSDSVKYLLTGGVDRVVCATCAFAAVKEDGSVVTWGDDRAGGNSNNVKSELSGSVDRVVGTGYAFAAVKQDGSVVTWGGDSDSVKDQLTGGVDHVVGRDSVFGGNSDQVRDQLTRADSWCFRRLWERPSFRCSQRRRFRRDVRKPKVCVNSESVKSELSGVLQVKANLPA